MHKNTTYHSSNSPNNLAKLWKRFSTFPTVERYHGRERIARFQTREGDAGIPVEPGNEEGSWAFPESFHFPNDYTPHVFPLYYIYDHLGNTRVTYRNLFECVIDEQNGASGSYPTHYVLKHLHDYFPYGKTLREWYATNEDTERFQTTHHQRDMETMLDHRGARFYDADVGRFLSLDPLAADFPTLGDYVYVADNPLMFVDPDGRKLRFAKGTGLFFRIKVISWLAITSIFSRKARRSVLGLIKDDKIHTIYKYKSYNDEGEPLGFIHTGSHVKSDALFKQINMPLPEWDASDEEWEASTKKMDKLKKLSENSFNGKGIATHIYIDISKGARKADKKIKSWIGGLSGLFGITHEFFHAYRMAKGRAIRRSDLDENGIPKEENAAVNYENDIRRSLNESIPFLNIKPRLYYDIDIENPHPGSAGPAVPEPDNEKK